MRVKSSAFHFTTDTQAFWENTHALLKKDTWKFATRQSPKQLSIPSTRPALLNLMIRFSSGFSA